MSYLVPPRIILPSVREAEIKIGDDFVLVCYASGDPTPNITWTREGFSAIESIGTGNFLRLVNVSRMSAGLYRCTAGNGYGNNATSLTIVSIICKCLILFVLDISLSDASWCDGTSVYFALHCSRHTNKSHHGISPFMTRFGYGTRFH